ncbi:MAG: hypothetical protein Q9225_001186 [Loekoesia sp. 1 TL-2023]
MFDGPSGDGGQNAIYWDPTFLTKGNLKGKQKDSPPLYAVIVLNQPIEDKQQLLELCSGGTFPFEPFMESRLIVHQAKTTVYADGGANQVFHLAKTDEEQETMFPAGICGDLDSIEPEVKEWFASKGVAVIQDPDQYSTDLTKSLKYIRSMAQNWPSSTENDHSRFSDVIEDVMNAVLVGGIGGRFDQGFSQLHHLYTASEDTSTFGGRVFLINSQSVCFLLHKGLNHIKTPVCRGLFRENVGIIPIGRRSVISTKGLEWNLDGQVTEFGGLLSTSNHIKNEWIEIDTTEKVLLTIELDLHQLDAP